MRNDTRRQFNAYMAQQAKLNGVSDATQQFAVEPSVQQTLERKIQESSSFLGEINMIGVDEQVGDKVKLGVSGPIAGRTDVSQVDRQTRDVASLDDDRYTCESTEYDTHIGWNRLDAWAKFPNFQTLLRDEIVRRQALDRIMIGFNGTRAAKQTDINANPLLQDVNIGWLQKMRDNAPAHVMTDGATAGQITYGDGGDYKTLDALVYDAVYNLIDPWFRDDPDLRVITGRDLLHDKYFPLVNNNDAPTERRALDMILSQKRMGGEQAMGVPYFPERTILVTAPSNLSVYWQNGSRRRYLKDKPERKRIENYDSSNDAYVVEDYGFACLIENVVSVDEAAA